MLDRLHEFDVTKKFCDAKGTVSDMALDGDSGYLVSTSFDKYIR